MVWLFHTFSFPRPGLPLEDLVLRMHWMAERSKEKDNRVISIGRIWLVYDQASETRRFWLHCPFLLRQKKLKVWKSHAQPLSSVRRHVFQILMLSIACLQGLIIWRCLGLKIRTSRYALSRWSPQKPSAAMSSLAASSRIGHTWENFSSAVKDCKTGSSKHHDKPLREHLQWSPMISLCLRMVSLLSGKKVHVQQRN